jgi:hypothetical protein
MSSRDSSLAIEIDRARRAVARAEWVLRRRVLQLEGLVDAAYGIAGDLPASDPMPDDRLAADEHAEQDRTR